MNPTFNDKKFQVSFLIFSSLLIFLGRQLDTGITNYDDAYYAQKAKEILESGSFWTLTFSGAPAFDNTPLPLWFTALAFSIFGVSSFSAVFSSAIFATGIVLITYRLGVLLYKDYWIAFASAFVLLFPGIFVDSSRRGMVDIPLAFFVTLSFYAFLKTRDHKHWYIIFGLSTAGAILSKSVLGLFPLIIIGTFFILSKQWRQLINIWFISGSLIALILGFSWHIINWQHFGQSFIDNHFGWIIMSRSFGGTKETFYFLGYAKDFLKNYWPWLPFALWGLIKFGKRGFIEKDKVSLLFFLWPVITFLVMSSSKNQTLRYLLMIFPPLAIICAKTISDWLGADKKNHALGVMVSIIAITILFVNATFFQVKVTLAQSSKEVRELAAIINLNTPENQTIGNYYLTPSNPRLALRFYSDRDIEMTVIRDPKILIETLSSNPKKTWLGAIHEFKKLINLYPEKIYLIAANEKYAFFTSMINRKEISYDFSTIRLPIIK